LKKNAIEPANTPTSSLPPWYYDDTPPTHGLVSR
jgi:hypothetical protein